MRVLVSGGGTGGHISPVLAVISELKKIDKTVEILYVGSTEGLESKIIPQTGLDFRTVNSGKFRRYHKNMIFNLIDPTTLFKNARDLFRFVKGYFEAKNIIKEFDPDVVFTKGGFVSLPVGLAAKSLGYPLVIHESDSIMGLSNKILAKKADKICVSYPEKYYSEIDPEKIVFSGNPIREDILSGDKKRGLDEFGLNGDLPVLLVTGGSQGALAINQAVSQSLGKLLLKYQIIHIAGERDYDWLEYQAGKLSEENRANYHLYNFLSGNLKDAYAVSDLVISRAGNNFIAELAAVSKPVILIPLASSANNHQVENAKILSRMGAALLMPQEHLTPDRIARQVDRLFEEPEELRSMAEKIHELFAKDAAAVVADEIYKRGKLFIEESKIEETDEEQAK